MFILVDIAHQTFQNIFNFDGYKNKYGGISKRNSIIDFDLLTCCRCNCGDGGGVDIRYCIRSSLQGSSNKKKKMVLM